MSTTTTTNRREVIVPATHRGLRYKDGALTDVLEAGRYRLPRSLPFLRGPIVEGGAATGSCARAMDRLLHRR